ncbi:hypothetical protein GLP21_12025 [Photobacterium carnosum]|uniref:Uncharacterized protein n=1 Tax=Photobacterium carnosum TaxID=2023717 RepID=A0A2N4UVZ2_9GAMM|nr:MULTISPECIES: hypothetical protein [Photobacterium]MCD9475785.1 hypothetical protein [Photobacterium phosphoreum]MCD9485843.1 hypothetical protein [Photobacterium iliopiscarium]MCD9507646.1 hypothetical protein [Photobacterium phosphoreum]MCD9539524.1 hypothetical protein [Photobacterium carnosum]MCD9543198.1 hypothetical protein [Photobacterium carnosum]
MRTVDIFHFEKYSNGAFLIGDLCEVNGQERVIDAEYICCNGITEELIAGLEDGWEMCTRRTVDISSLSQKQQQKINKLILWDKAFAG